MTIYTAVMINVPLAFLLLLATASHLGCQSRQAPPPAAEPAQEGRVDPFMDTPSIPAPAPHEQASMPKEETVTPSQLVEPSGTDSLPRPDVARVSQLPQRFYPVPESATEFIASKEDFGEMAQQLRVHIESDIETYDIRDIAGLQQLHSTLMNIAIFQGRYADARTHIESIRLLEADPARRETTGLMMGAIVDSWEQAGRGNPASEELYVLNLRGRIDAMHWELVEAEIMSRKENADRMNAAIFETIIASGLDPMFKEQGQIDSTIARQLVTLKSILYLQMPLMDRTSSVYLEVIEANSGG